MTHSAAIDSRETAVLTRAIQPNKYNLSAAATRALLRIQLHPEGRQRLHELQVKIDHIIARQHRGKTRASNPALMLLAVPR